MHWPFWDYLDHSSWAAGQDLMERAWPTTPTPEQGRQGQQWQPKPRALCTSLVTGQGQARPWSCVLGLADSWAVVEQKIPWHHWGWDWHPAHMGTWFCGHIEGISRLGSVRKTLLVSTLRCNRGERTETGISLSSKRAQLFFFSSCSSVCAYKREDVVSECTTF